ncbi:TIGR01212 family radical SAM protein, partial [bacterium]|nr:TIGR01212 family radical SAM protein [candidate division CSSED10-310 bacterium]
MAVVRFSEYLRALFGERVQRVSLHAGLSCPNRDGTLGEGGCIYCSNEAFNPHVGRGLGVREQMERGCRLARQRYGARAYLAYFQTFSNTYAPVQELRNMFDDALSFPDVVGLMVATRPDCLT